MKTFLSALLVTSSSLIALTSCHSEVKFAGGTGHTYDAVSSQVFNFTASTIADGSVSIKDSGRYTAVDITQAETRPSQVIQPQLTRKSYDDVFKQGHNARFSTETFQLSEAGMLDLLLVIDDSSSMKEEQDMVATGLSALIGDFNDTNWQIAVISTTDECVTKDNLITKGDINAEAKFSAAVRRGTNGSSIEMGFPKSILALKGECSGIFRNGLKWVRPGSSLGVMILSDEDNCGSAPGEVDKCRNVYGKNAGEMVSFLRSIRAPEEAKIYAIVDKDGTCPNAGGTGTMYVQAAALTNGTVGSICHDFTQANGYSDYLKSVSKDVSRLIKRQFTLSAVPDLALFDVFVDGQKVDATGAFTVVGKVVYIDPVRFKVGQKITFSYSHDAIPMFSSVAAQATPDMSSVKISVNGIALSQDTDFTFDPVKREFAFAKMPPEDAKVTVSYIEDLKLLTHFGVDLTGVRPDTLAVSVNGVAVDSKNYSYGRTGIDFPTPPTDGAYVTVSWKTEANKILSYAAAINDARHVAAWTLKDKKTGDDVAAQWDQKNLVFTPDNVVEGKELSLVVDFGAKSSVRTVDLPDVRIDDDVKIVAYGQDGICSPKDKPVYDTGGAPPTAMADVSKDDLQDTPDTGNNKDPSWKSRYKGSELEIQCKDDMDYTDLAIHYKHEVSRTNHFKVSLPEGVNPDGDNLAWKVFIAGVPIKQFKRTGAEVEIEDDLLPPEIRVDIEVVTYTKVTK